MIATDRLSEWIFSVRIHPLPGRHVTDHQMRLYMTFRQTDGPAISAAKASISTATAYRHERDHQLPSSRKKTRGRRRPDPLAEFFDAEVVPMLKAAPELRAVAIFEEMLVTLMKRQKPVYQAFVSQVNTWLASAAAPDINDLVALTGLSLRQVQRGCNRYFGSPPKELARKYRALRAAVAMTHGDPDLDDLLVEGFYDQSHVIREIKHFTGMTPRTFAEHPTELNREIAKRIALERQNPIRRSGVIT